LAVTDDHQPQNVAIALSSALVFAGAVAYGATTNADNPAASSPPVFSRDIAPIVSRHCTGCHHAQGSAPFSLTSYDDVRRRARQIAGVLSSRLMPPWLPEDSEHELIGRHGLTELEIQTVQAWVEAGVPEGDAASPAVSAPISPGWTLGEPDLVLTMPEPYVVPAEGQGVIRTFVLPTNLPGRRAVSAIEVRPSNPRVVRHVWFSLDTTGSARMLDEADADPGYPTMADIGFVHAGSFGGWAPGSEVAPLPPGIVRVMPAGADLLVQIHFAATGKEEIEQTSIGIYFAREPVKTVVVPITLGSYWLDIPAGRKAYEVVDSFTLPHDVQLISLSPHAHYLCRHVEVLAETPDGKVHELLRITDWNPHWQQPYRFCTPIDLQAGTVLRMRMIYDNSEENPQNPHHPPRRVTTGHTMEDEMSMIMLHVAPADPHTTRSLEASHRAQQLDRMQKAQEVRSRQSQ